MFPTHEGWLRFDTVTFNVISPGGNGFPTGNIDLIFCDPQGVTRATHFTPEGVEQLYQILGGVVAMMSKPTGILAIPGSLLEGEIKVSPTTSTYFGQAYESDVLKALGILVMRANLLDQNLIELSAALTGASLRQSSGQYYSSVNMKARLDAIRALAQNSDMSKYLIDLCESALDRIKKATDQRNALIHAKWRMRKGKHRAESYKPNASHKINELTVTEKMVLGIVEKYNVASALLAAAIQRTAFEKAERNTASTPSSTDPLS